MKNTVKDIIVKLFTRSCTVCVAVSFFVMIIAQLAKNADTGGGRLAVTLSQYALFYLFSFIIAAASFLFLIPIAKALCYLIHFATCSAAFLIIFSLAGKISFATVSSGFKAVTLCVFFYVVGLAVFSLTKLLTKEKNSKGKSDSAQKSKPAYEKRF